MIQWWGTDMTAATDYIRTKADRMRQMADDPRKDYSDERRGNMTYASRILHATAEEIDQEFHVTDEEET